MAISAILVAAIYSSTVSDVFAKPRKPAVVSKGSIQCVGAGINPDKPAEQVTCCQDVKYSNGKTVTYCTNCDNTNPPSNCGPRYTLSNELGNAQQQPPSSVLPPTTSEQSNNTSVLQGKTLKPGGALKGGEIGNNNLTNSNDTLQ